MLSSVQTYGQYLYTLTQRHPRIQSSTLVLIPLGATMGSVRGILTFDNGFALRVVEQLDFRTERIEYYSYTVEKDGERLYWYDPQPHPNVPSLQSTHPHHKHVPPDIKHNRIPAPGLSFTQINLPFLIQEIEDLIATDQSAID